MCEFELLSLGCGVYSGSTVTIRGGSGVLEANAIHFGVLKIRLAIISEPKPSLKTNLFVVWTIWVEVLSN